MSSINPTQTQTQCDIYSSNNLLSLMPLSLPAANENLINYRTDMMWDCRWEELLASVFSLGNGDQRLTKDVSLYFLHLEAFFVECNSVDAKPPLWIHSLKPHLLEKSIELFEKGISDPSSLTEPPCVTLVEKLNSLLSQLHRVVSKQSQNSNEDKRLQKLKRLTGFFGFGSHILGNGSSSLVLNDLQRFGLALRISVIPLLPHHIASIISTFEAAFDLSHKLLLLNRFPSVLYLNLLLPMPTMPASSLEQKSLQLYESFSKSILFKRMTRLSPLRYLLFYSNDGLDAVLDIKVSSQDNVTAIQSLFMK